MQASSVDDYLSVPAPVHDGERAMPDELFWVILEVTDGLHAAADG